MSKNISFDDIKVMLRETGTKVKPKYDYGTNIIVSSALKQVQKDWLHSRAKRTDQSLNYIINNLVSKFNPVKTKINTVLDRDAARSMSGFLNKRITKVFGTRANVKFTSFYVYKSSYHKLNHLSSYYNISRSAVIRLIIDENMKG